MIKERIIEQKIIPVVRGNNATEASEIIDACVEGGLQVIEMTYTNPEASQVIAKYNENENLLVGAGSVLNVELAQKAFNDHVAFIVSPNFNKEVAMFCAEKNLLYVPGCFTPSEIAEASNCGISFVKLFPGDAVDMSYIKAVKGPMPHMEFMVTGGVDVTNYQEWLSHGASCVGLGSSLTGDVSTITAKIKKIIVNV